MPNEKTAKYFTGLKFVKDGAEFRSREGTLQEALDVAITGASGRRYDITIYLKTETSVVAIHYIGQNEETLQRDIRRLIRD